VTDDPIVWSYYEIYLWKAAVEKAGTTDVEAVLKALPGIKLDTPAGEIIVDRKNHHTSKPVYIGRILADGQFEIIWKSPGLVDAIPWSEYTYPERGCDWSKGGKGTYDVVGGDKIFLDSRALPIEPF
jgi:urea transport system substrate-binding protein